MILLEAVRSFLTERNYSSVFIDVFPDRPDECIAVLQWDHVPDFPGDDSGKFYLQIRVRRYDSISAMTTCDALVTLLNSGVDQAPIALNYPGRVIGWVNRYSRILERTPTTATAYAEIVLWGQH